MTEGAELDFVAVFLRLICVSSLQFKHLCSLNYQSKTGQRRSVEDRNSSDLCSTAEIFVLRPLISLTYLKVGYPCFAYTL